MDKRARPHILSKLQNKFYNRSEISSKMFVSSTNRNTHHSPFQLLMICRELLRNMLIQKSQETKRHGVICVYIMLLKIVSQFICCGKQISSKLSNTICHLDKSNMVLLLFFTSNM